MDAFYKNLAVHNLQIRGQPLLTNDMKINPKLLPVNVTANKPINSSSVNHGAFARRDINAGMLLLEISEDGSYASLTKDNELMHEITSTNLNIVGIKHEIANGVRYILTLTENAILEMETDNRKYILTSRKNATILKSK